MSVSLISWNVNGIRAVAKKGFYEFFKKSACDILCLQETKAHPDQLDDSLKNHSGYYSYFNSAIKKGYSGTCVYSKIEPKSVSCGIGIEEHDNEGRVLTLDYDSWYLVNVYTPNAKRGLTRLQYRQKWDNDFLKYVNKLQEQKPVIFCGDLNVAHKEIDLANPKSNERNPGFTIEERNGFDNLLAQGFIDTFREFNSKGGNYTWWSYMFNARAKNIGWRIDYFLTSNSLKRKLLSSCIMPEIPGSDHCPVKLEINIKG